MDPGKVEEPHTQQDQEGEGDTPEPNHEEESESGSRIGAALVGSSGSRIRPSTVLRIKRATAAWTQIGRPNISSQRKQGVGLGQRGPAGGESGVVDETSCGDDRQPVATIIAEERDESSKRFSIARTNTLPIKQQLARSAVHKEKGVSASTSPSKTDDYTVSELASPTGRKSQTKGSQIVSAVDGQSLLSMQTLLCKCFVRWLQYVTNGVKNIKITTASDLSKSFSQVMEVVTREDCVVAAAPSRRESTRACATFLESRGLLQSSAVAIEGDNAEVDKFIGEILEGRNVDGWLAVIWEVFIVRHLQRVGHSASRKDMRTRSRSQLRRSERGARDLSPSLERGGMTNQKDMRLSSSDLDREEEGAVVERLHDWVRVQCSQLAVLVKNEKELFSGRVLSALVASMDETYLHDPFMEEEDMIVQAVAHVEVDMHVKQVLPAQDILKMTEILKSSNTSATVKGEGARTEGMGTLWSCAMKAFYIYVGVLYESTIIKDLRRCESLRNIVLPRGQLSSSSPSPTATTSAPAMAVSPGPARPLPVPPKPERQTKATTSELQKEQEGSEGSSQKRPLSGISAPVGAADAKRDPVPPLEISEENLYMEEFEYWKFKMNGTGIMTPMTNQQVRKESRYH